MPRKPEPTATADLLTPRKRGLPQADLFDRFAHLKHQRDAGRLAERVLRMLSTADPETAHLAINIASTAMNMEDNGHPVPLPSNAQVEPI